MAWKRLWPLTALSSQPASRDYPHTNPKCKRGRGNDSPSLRLRVGVPRTVWDPPVGMNKSRQDRFSERLARIGGGQSRFLVEILHSRDVQQRAIYYFVGNSSSGLLFDSNFNSRSREQRHFWMADVISSSVRQEQSNRDERLSPQQHTKLFRAHM